jgi:hypothetical protein
MVMGLFETQAVALFAYLQFKCDCLRLKPGIFLGYLKFKWGCLRLKQGIFSEHLRFKWEYLQLKQGISLAI